MITSSMIAAVEKRYGELFQIDTNGKITRFNEQGAAALFASAKGVIFAEEEGQYYIYNHDTGLYESQSREKMLSLLDLFIHECAEEFVEEALEDKRKQSVLSSMLKFLPAACGERNFFRHSDKIFIHVANGVLELSDSNEWVLKPFSPDYRSRNRCEVVYRPGAECPRFRHELLDHLLTANNQDLVQNHKFYNNIT